MIPESERPPRVRVLGNRLRVIGIILLVLLLAENFVYMYYGLENTTNFAIIVSLLMPYCALEGARSLHSTALSCFYGWCLVNVMIFFFTIVISTRSLVNDIHRDNGELDLNTKIRIFAYSVGYATTGASIAGFIWTRELLADHITNPESEFFRRHVLVADFTEDLPQQQQHPVVQRGCPSLVVDQLREFQWVGSSGSEEDKMCVICQDMAADGDMFKTLPCGHEYHTDCINQWLGKSELCPMCNDNVVQSFLAKQQEHSSRLESGGARDENHTVIELQDIRTVTLQ